MESCDGAEPIVRRHIVQPRGGLFRADESRSNSARRELARARRIAEAHTGAGARAIVDAYIRELSVHPLVLPENEASAWKRP